MEPFSEPTEGKEPITAEIDQDELAALIALAAEERIAPALEQAMARQYLRARVSRWIEQRRREDCQ